MDLIHQKTNNIHIWLRAETKSNEYRTPITPVTAYNLIKKGFKITVEKSCNRCYPDQEYQEIGCEMVEGGSWRTAPCNCYVIGLKELNDDIEKICHCHIYFAHCFKKQSGYQTLLGKFIKGGGRILDLEYLTDNTGTRLTSFGYSAGVAGGLLALMIWLGQRDGIPNDKIHPAKSKPIPPLLSIDATISNYVERLSKNGELPRVLVIGPNGRVGRGATDILKKAGITATGWTRSDTEKIESPYKRQEILDYDILINAINLTQEMPHFVTHDDISNPNRKLTVCVDISCDYLNPFNPLPIYNRASTFADPIINLTNHDSIPPFDVCSIDNMPSLLPVESSNDFSNQLYPHLLQLEKSETWTRCRDLYKKHISQLAN